MFFDEVKEMPISETGKVWNAEINGYPEDEFDGIPLNEKWLIKNGS